MSNTEMISTLSPMMQTLKNRAEQGYYVPRESRHTPFRAQWLWDRINNAKERSVHFFKAYEELPQLLKDTVEQKAKPWMSTNH